MLSIIVARGRNGELGQRGRIPWSRQQKTDIEWFRSHITGKPVIVGRATYEDMQTMLGQQPVYVISRQMPSTTEPNVTWVSDISKLRSLQESTGEAMVLGGATIYELLLAYTQRLYLTELDAEFSRADRFFPAFNQDDFKVLLYQPHPADANNSYPYRFRILKRRKPPKSLSEA